MRSAGQWLVLAGLAVLVTGCSVRMGEPSDGPGRPIDPDELPTVVPRDEPRSRYGNPDSYVVHGQRYHVRDSAEGYVAEGVASWYGSKFHGRRTSSGETFDMYRMTAAHRSLPLPTYVRVTNLDNGRSTVVRVNDRGPFVDDRLIDLSYAAATRLGVVERGTAPVRVRALTPGESTGGDGGGAPAADESGTGASGSAGGAVYIQVGAFRHLENAEQMRARVLGADIDAVTIEAVETAAGERVHRVRIGPLPGQGDREALLDRLRRAGIAAVRVITD